MRRTPPLRFAISLACLITGQASAQGLPVTGSLREAGSARTVPGAALYLVDVDAVPVGVTLSDAEGAFHLDAPTTGAYRLRVERIGFLTELSAEFLVGRDGNTGITLDLRVRPVELDPMAVETDRVCRLEADTGRELIQVWGEARKALAATLVSGAGSDATYLVEIAERELDRGLEVRSERADTLLVAADHAFGFVPIEQLEESGWGRVEDGVVTQFYGPSPELLLSSWFGATHCLTLAKPLDSADRLGLRFESIPDSMEVGMEGVFWLAPGTWRLDEIEFRFTIFPELETAPHQGGAIALEATAAGAWHVTRWHMRRPIMRRGPLVWSPSRGNGRAATRRYTLTGYWERTGRVLSTDNR